MIKELKANFYRILRSKSFIVICILIFVGAVFSALEIKMIADNPGDWIGYVEEAMAGATESSESVAINYEDASASAAVFTTNIINLGEVDNLTGVMRMTWCVDLICFLHCIFIALFISAEYKSHFHVNHFSLNSSPVFIVLIEWISLMITVVAVEFIAYGIAIGISVLICDSFSLTDVATFVKYGVLMMGVMIVYASFAFMMAYLRKAAALSIVLSSLFVFGILDFICGFASVWISFVQYFALNNIFTSIAYGHYGSINYAFEVVVILFYLAVFLGIPLIVASTRDPY